MNLGLETVLIDSTHYEGLELQSVLFTSFFFEEQGYDDIV